MTGGGREVGCPLPSVGSYDPDPVGVPVKSAFTLEEDSSPPNPPIRSEEKKHHHHDLVAVAPRPTPRNILLAGVPFPHEALSLSSPCLPPAFGKAGPTTRDPCMKDCPRGGLPLSAGDACLRRGPHARGPDPHRRDAWVEIGNLVYLTAAPG